MEKPPQTCEDKKSQGLRLTNLNPLCEIKLYKITWPFCPKDLLYSTYNLIHVRDIVIPCCSLVDPSIHSKGLRSLTSNSNIQILE